MHILKTMNTSNENRRATHFETNISESTSYQRRGAMTLEKVGITIFFYCF